MDYETPQDLFDALSAPFMAEVIDWRVGPTTEKSRKEGEPVKGQPLCYIDARVVMDRLDAMCGPDGWSNTYTFGPNGSVVCNLSIRMPNGDWIVKSDGAGATDMEAEKGALSDAFKRSAVRWGIGRYLYDLKAAWIVLEQRGRSFVIPQAERNKLDALHDDFARTHGWGERAGVQAYRLLKKIVGETVTDAASAQDFKTKNKSEIDLLPVAMRRHLFESLDRIGANAREAA